MAVARLDLKKVNATSFSLTVACKVNDAIRTELERLLAGSLKVGKRMAFGIAHRKGEGEWVDIAIVDYTEAEYPHLHVTFMYGIKDIPRPPRGVSKPDRLLQILSMAEEPLIFSCHVSFLYKEGAARSIIQLPISLFRTDKVGFHEIKGVELSRREPDEFKYDIVISVEKDGSLSHEVAFDYEARARPGIEGDLLRKAVGISQQFLK
jgi:hypothetical protein